MLVILLLGEVVELEADPSRGKCRVLGAEIGRQLVNDNSYCRLAAAAL